MPTTEWRENNIDKMRAYRREWYQRNKITERKKARIRQKERRRLGKDRSTRLTREWFQNYKASLTCSMCPENTSVCLDFHHRDRMTKIDPVSVMVSRGRSRKAIQQEIAKCDVLCANCHRKETYAHSV